MYLKQGEHLMKKGVYTPALYYLDLALKLNPESKVGNSINTSSLYYKHITIVNDDHK